MDTCANCKFGRSIGSDIGVACHRFPPTITKVEGESITSHFPLVNKGSWCGEHIRGNTRKTMRPG